MVLSCSRPVDPVITDLKEPQNPAGRDPRPESDPAGVELGGKAANLSRTKMWPPRSYSRGSMIPAWSFTGSGDRHHPLSSAATE